MEQTETARLRALKKRPRMRPLFEIPLAVPDDDFVAAVRKRLRARSHDIEGVVLDKGAELTTERSRVHFWSPHLSVQVRVREDGTRVLLGRFGPHEGVWTLFTGLYGIIGMGGVCALMFGASQAMAHQSPWALLGVPAAIALAAFVYGAVFIGQGLGAEEMHVLRSFVEHCVDDAARDHAARAAQELPGL